MLVSIDVTDKALYLAAGSVSSGIVKIKKTASADLPESTVQDGIVKNRGAFTANLRKLLGGLKIRSGPAVLTIASGALLTRRLELPQSKPRELALMARSEMFQTAGAGGGYVYEYSSIRGKAAPESKTVPVWAYALPRDVVDGYYAILKGQKLKPLALDAHQNSVEKLFIDRRINGKAMERSSALFVGVEEAGIEAHLFSDGRRAFSRPAPVSAAGLKGSFADRGALSGAADFWKELDVTSDRVLGDPIPAEALRRYVGGIADELRKIIRFQLRRDAGNPVAYIFLYGTVPQARGVDAALYSMLGIPAETIYSISGVEAGGQDIPRYLNAIGALIRL